MQCSKTIKVIKLALALLLPLCSSARLLGQKSTRHYDPVGPPETTAIERTLDKRLGVYTWGIWPRSEKFDGSLPGQSLPKNYVQRLKTWLPRILKKDLLPQKIASNQWRGIRKLDGYSDVILGQFKNNDETVRIQFRADGLGIGITALSKNYFPNGVENLTSADIFGAISRLFNFPEDEIQGFTVEKHLEAMGEADKKISVCYGKLRCNGYDERKGPIPRQPGQKAENVRTWWNYIPFWLAKGKIFFSTMLVEWEGLPPNLDRYTFKLE